MFTSTILKVEWLSWKVVRAHVCTLAVSVGVAATWRVARAGARYTALPFLVARTVAALLLAAPLALLQLSTGHLSQQDAVGVWRAVPFFKGTGYIRLVTSAACAVSTGACAALAATLVLHTATHPEHLVDCYNHTSSDDNVTLSETTHCLEQTFLSVVKFQPEYYAAPALLAMVIFVGLPFVLYNPVRNVRRVLFALSPCVACAGVAVASGAGDAAGLWRLASDAEWGALLAPHVWQAALCHALLACHAATGYLHCAGGTIYADVDVQWASISLVATTVVSDWLWALFWAGVADVADTSPYAVLHSAAQLASSGTALWSALAFALLLLSACISMAILMFPILEHVKRLCGVRWRAAGALVSLVLGGAVLAALVFGGAALSALDDHVVPLLLTLATMQELCGFVLVYGSPLLLGSAAWWAVALVWAGGPGWPALAAAAALGFAIFITFAVLVVLRQQQYGYLAKLKLSFKSSRQWGPRDPITHYYWMSRASGEGPGASPARGGWRFGQMSVLGGPSKIISALPAPALPEKRRAHSDDWMWTGHRRQQLCEPEPPLTQRRSRSLEWAAVLCGTRPPSPHDRPYKQPPLQIEVHVHQQMSDDNNLTHADVNLP